MTKTIYSIARPALISSLLLSGGLFMACSSDDAGSQDGAGGGASAGGAGAGEGGAAGSEAAVYAVTTQVTDGTDWTSYVVLSSALDGADLDLDNGIEVAGRAIGVGPNMEGTLFVGASSSSVLTRYRLNDSGKLEKDGELDFGVAGLTSISEYQGQFQFVSADKAYFFDGSTGSVVVWSPAEMKFLKKLDLSTMVFENELLSFGGFPLRVGDDVIAFAGWRTDAGPATAPVTRVGFVSVNSQSDELTIVTDEALGCSYARDGFYHSDGNVYMATEAWASAMSYLNSANAAPCLLRFDPATKQFDDSYKVELTDLLEADTVGSLVVGPGDKTYLMALDAASYAGPAVGRVLASSKSWHFATLSLGDTPSAAVIDGLDSVGGSQLPYDVGDAWYLPILDGTTSTDLQMFGEDGPGALGANIPGMAFSAVRLK